jgi:hypothetical protein
LLYVIATVAMHSLIDPKAPNGKDANWLPTNPNRRFELMFRLYAPTEALLQKQWVLPDVEGTP